MEDYIVEILICVGNARISSWWSEGFFKAFIKLSFVSGFKYISPIFGLKAITRIL